jgi:hypothetical protein
MQIITWIKFLIVAILSVFYWPFNVMFMYLKKHYFQWKETDMISYVIATPIYWFCFLIVFIISVPLEILGEGLHPPLDSFR